MKVCRTCKKEKDLSEYYKHKDMFDGHLNICKDCKRSGNSKYREDNIEKVKEYDRNRPNSKERSNKRLLAFKSKSYLEKNTIYKKSNLNKSESVKNQKIVNDKTAYAIKTGKIVKPENCERCTETEIETHHPNYLEPLTVIWLCKKCHGEEHKRINDERSNDLGCCGTRRTK